VCGISKNLAHGSNAVKGNLCDRGLCGLGRVLFNQLGYDRRELRANATPVGDAIMLQID
jgi:hypothetical protein